ncbi:hypothetical protein ANN_11685 [Periplaneta americana]|uniref:Uncharacterized protein n=1 Tax=Periplaneta americana TaxID=6978 RepID=A0ABQ8T768_PERAM|nr:hypothetical protein ANN_11685 [Periplaneta americana]
MYGLLPVVLHGCETWTLILREEQRLRVFENKVLRKIFGAKRDEVTGEWRKLHNAELHTLYTSPDIIRNIKFRRLRWAGHVARMGESRNAYRVLVGRPEGKRPLGRPRRRWEDNIKMDLREVGYDGRDWINLARDRDQWRAYVREAMNLRGEKFPPAPGFEPEFSALRADALSTKPHRIQPRRRAELSLIEFQLLVPSSGRPLHYVIDVYEHRTEAHTCAEVHSLRVTTALYEAETWTLRRNEEKRIEAFELWIWRRMEHVKWTDRIRNKAVLERVGEERMMLKLMRMRKRN